MLVDSFDFGSFVNLFVNVLCVVLFVSVLFILIAGFRVLYLDVWFV